MKTTFIATVLNEEKNVNRFIKSILSQSRKVDEIIIVDGGSTDGTVAQIKNSKVKIIIKKGNRSVGRNEAIKNASHEIILCSDSGCILDKDWVKNIIKPFENPKVDVVAGYYKGNAKNIFEKCLVPYVLVMPDKIDKDNFLPAARSMAFKKSIWKKIGGFSEEFSNNEDYIFARKLKNAGAKIVFEKKAIVNWIPRSTLKQTFVMFFRFAFGDAQAKILRPKVLLIFSRYIVGFYLLFLSFLMNSPILLHGVILGIAVYLIWSIAKNYKYVKNIQAFFFLPLLQITSDIAVLSGTAFGLIKSINIKNIISVIKNNKLIVFLVGIYMACMILFINWGVPGNSHPFNYFMDEWHQAQSVRNVFSQGSPNVEGSANGSMFHFFLSGIYLLPFIALGIFNPFSIKSSVDSLEMQQKLFEILRTNTLLFGVLSIILIAYIAKKYFKLNPILTTFLFAVNPIFLTLSNYFKYDIALMFWIILSFLFLLKYSLKPNPRDFFLGAFFSGIALSVKVSAIPLLPILICAFLLFNPARTKNFWKLIGGIFIFFCTFLLFGIPDLLLGKGSIKEYLFDNLIRTPNLASNYILNMPYPFYLVFQGLTSVFGYVLSIISFFGIIFILFSKKDKLRWFIFLSFLIFLISLFPLRIEARGNRLLVLLPFLALIGSIFISDIYLRIAKNFKKLFIIAITILFFFQGMETFSWIYIKLKQDIREKTSLWVEKNIPTGTLIGIENIPIYQSLPDVVLKEFYLKQNELNYPTRFSYQIISNKSILLPSYIVISNEEVSLEYLKESSKKNLIARLNKEGYSKILHEKIDLSLLEFFHKERDYFMSGLIQSPISISIYKKLL